MPDLKRRAGRTEIEVDVEIRANEDLYAATAKNIGLGGVFLATPRVRAVGDRIVIKFRLPGGDEPIAVESEVRWVRPPAGDSAAPLVGMGLRFVNLAFEDSEAIQRFLGDREREVDRRARSS